MGGTAPVVLMVYAHPDDETFGCAGTTAQLSRRGVEVHILLATRGQAGEINDPALDTPVVRRDLAGVREAEARCAAARVGAAGIEFLDYVDGTLETVDGRKLAAQVLRHILRLRPDVVITFGPEGIYGHPDHVAAHRATVAAVARAANLGAEEGGPERHDVKRLFYQVVTEEFAEGVNASRGPVMLAGAAHPFVGYPVSAITTSVDITKHREEKLQALQCHRTQTYGRWDELRARFSEGQLYEHFVLAASSVPDDPGLSTDILAGIG